MLMQAGETVNSDFYYLDWWPDLIASSTENSQKEATVQQSNSDFRAIYLAGLARENRIRSESRKAWTMTVLAGIVLGLAGTAIHFLI